MEKEKIEQEFADGFNRGYWLYNYEKEMAKDLIRCEIINDNDFTHGFKEGVEEAQREKDVTQEFEDLRSENNEQINDLER